MGDETIGVLIVDDQAPFRLAAAAVVRATKGFAVLGQASSGEEAVAKADELEPQLVLMDINMDGIGGIEATRRITGSHPKTRVLLLSTYDVDSLPADVSTSGAAAYAHKEEFGPDVLARAWSGGLPVSFKN